jgi:hypothetical protein
MPIKLHCEHCGRKIEAPDSAGGRWGKCPACYHRVYVPQLEPADELKLAPIDETEEEKKKRLMREAFEFTKDILQEEDSSEAAPTPGRPAPEISEPKLTEYVIRYLRQMADGDLDAAQSTADRITPHRQQAVAILDSLARSDPPDPELEDIPKQVLSGLIRNLRVRIS